MTERERLIELMGEAKRTDPETGSWTEYLADYLLDNGIIVLPCKVGDVVYFPYNGQIDELKVVCFVKYGYTTAAFFNAELSESCEICNFDKIVFLTKEDAEKHLQKRSRQNVGKITTMV